MSLSRLYFCTPKLTFLRWLSWLVKEAAAAFISAAVFFRKTGFYENGNFTTTICF